MAYFRFDINDATGDLDANRPVPFRLTPNISEFLTTIGVSGPLTASMIAVARCFAQPNFKVGLGIFCEKCGPILSQWCSKPANQEGDVRMEYLEKVWNVHCLKMQKGRPLC